MIDTRICADCWHWVPFNHPFHGSTGDCRARPVVPMGMQGDYYSIDAPRHAKDDATGCPCWKHYQSKATGASPTLGSLNHRDYKDMEA